MKLNENWTEAYAVTTMGSEDERVFVRAIAGGKSQVAYWAYGNVKILTVEGIDSICDNDVDFDEALEPLSECFEVAIAVDGGTIVAFDSADQIALGDGYHVIDSVELEFEELYEDYEDLSIILQN